MQVSKRGHSPVSGITALTSAMTCRLPKSHCLLCVFAALATANLCTADPPTPLTEYSSQHYTIRTDLPPSEARVYARHMDMVFTAYDRRFSSFRERYRGQMPLYLFRSAEQYMAFLDSHGISAENSDGIFFFAPTARGLAVFIDGRTRSQVFASLQHEGFHQFADSYIGQQLPVWVNEGLAEYFERAIVVQGRMMLGIPETYHLAMVQQAIEQGRSIPFDEIVAMTAPQWADVRSADTDRAGLLYAQAWSMVHFLIRGDDSKYAPLLERYLRLLSDGQSSQCAFATVFGSDLGSFERRWRDYISQLEPNPMNMATERMMVLAMGLQYLQQQAQPTPRNIHRLRRALVDVGFGAIWRAGEQERQYRATDDSLYGFPIGGAIRLFDLLEPTRSDLLPRITARGIKPQPTLIWSRDGEGELVADIEYR